MAPQLNATRARNLFLVALFILVSIFTAFNEGYVSLMTPVFWVSLIAGFLLCFWLALGTSTTRLLALMLGIFIIEYIKETIGMRSEMWSYHGLEGHYIFVVWTWVLAGLIVYVLATRLVIRLIRKLNLALPRWVNLVVLALIGALIPTGLGDYWAGAGALFWLFYAVVFMAGIAVAVRMEFPVFIGIVITAMIISNPSEYVGSIASRLWTFTYSPEYPPFFLLFGCWPLEILIQYALSGFMADEPLDKDTF